MVRSTLSKERMGGRVARSSLNTLLVNGSGAVVSFLVQVTLAQRLGGGGYGTYLLVMGWLALAQVFGKLELDATSVRFVGSYVATGRWSLLRGFLRSSRRAVVAMSFAIAAIGAFGTLLLADAMRNKHVDMPMALLVACLLLPLLTLLLLDGAVLQGVQRYVGAQLPPNLLRPLVFGGLILLAGQVTDTGLTVPMAVGANLAATSVALAVTWIWRQRAIPPEVRAVEPEYDRTTWARTASPLLAVSLGQVIISQQMGTIVIGVMLTTTQAAIYGAAAQLTIPIALVTSSVTYVAQSMIADLYSRDRARLQSLVRAVTWLSAAASFPAVIGLLLVGPYVLKLYGPGFEAGYPVLVILMIAELVSGLVGSLAGYLLTMTAHEREAAWILGAMAALNLVLAVVLTPKFGIIGTASATLATGIVRAAILRIYIRRAMGLRVPALSA